MRRIVLWILWGFSFCLIVNSASFASDINVFEGNDEQFLTAIGADHSSYLENAVSLSDSLQLTEQKVKDWIKVRIEVARLQNEMKGNASDYDNVVHAFFEEREVMLESLGWAVEEFDEAKERIQAVISAMDIADDLEMSKDDHAEEVAEIRANEFYSDEQKEELIKALQKLRNQKKELYIEPTKKDWPAVDPYREIIKKMTAWIAGNVPNPPTLPF